VVGGGFTGLSTALHLSRLGMSVAVLEAQRLGWGASGRNGGQMSGGQRRDVEWLERKYGLEQARDLWTLGEDAKALVKQLIAEHEIDCALTPGVALVAHKPGYVADYHHEADHLLKAYNYRHLEKLDAAATRELLGTQAFFGGYVDWDAAHLNPLKLALGVAGAAQDAGVTFFEGSPVEHFVDDNNHLRVTTPAGTIQTRHLVLACNAYLGRLAPRLAARMMPINNYIAVTAPLSDAQADRINPRNVAVADSRFVVNYFRLAEHRRLLFGGGESYRRGFPRDIGAFVRPIMTNIYPELADVPIDYAWGGRVAITLNRMPHLGRLTPRVYFAQGYSGHGVAMAHLAGKLIADAITTNSEAFERLAELNTPRFPGGRWLRWPALVAGMSYYALRDRW
jgi:gamma-glutamylputrescine oxidase